MHPVFKPTRKGDRLRCAYLNPDGHVVCSFERYELGKYLHYTKIAQSIGVTCNFPAVDGHLNGRIVFHAPAALVAIAGLPSPCVSVYLDNHSEKTKALGLKIDSVCVDSGAGHFTLEDNSSIGGCVSVQTGRRSDIPIEKDLETWEEIASLESWSQMPIVARYPAKEGRSSL